MSPTELGLKNRLLNNWFESYLDNWCDIPESNTALCSEIFYHKIPYTFLNYSRINNIKSITLPEKMLEYFEVDKNSRISIDQLEVWLSNWNDVYKTHLHTILEISRFLELKVVLCKGSAITHVVGDYHRFAADIDIELDCLDSCGVLIEELFQRGYKPHGNFRYRAENMPFAQFTLSAEVKGQTVLIDISSRYVKGFPDDYASLTQHQFIYQSFERATQSPNSKYIYLLQPDDWIIRFLLEITSNKCVRIRDISDLSYYIEHYKGSIHWDRLLCALHQKGLEPYWKACLLCFQEAKLNVVLNIIPKELLFREHTILPKGLLPNSHPCKPKSLIVMFARYRFMWIMHRSKTSKICTIKIILQLIFRSAIYLAREKYPLNNLDIQIPRYFWPSKYCEVVVKKWNRSILLGKHSTKSAK